MPNAGTSVNSLGQRTQDIANPTDNDLDRIAQDKGYNSLDDATQKTGMSADQLATRWGVSNYNPNGGSTQSQVAQTDKDYQGLVTKSLLAIPAIAAGGYGLSMLGGAGGGAAAGGLGASTVPAGAGLPMAGLGALGGGAGAATGAGAGIGAGIAGGALPTVGSAAGATLPTVAGGATAGGKLASSLLGGGGNSSLDYAKLGLNAASGIAGGIMDSKNNAANAALQQQQLAQQQKQFDASQAQQQGQFDTSQKNAQGVTALNATQLNPLAQQQSRQKNALLTALLANFSPTSYSGGSFSGGAASTLPAAFNAASSFFSPDATKAADQTFQDQAKASTGGAYQGANVGGAGYDNSGLSALLAQLKGKVGG